MNNFHIDQKNKILKSKVENILRQYLVSLRAVITRSTFYQRAELFFKKVYSYRYVKLFLRYWTVLLMVIVVVNLVRGFYAIQKANDERNEAVLWREHSTLIVRPFANVERATGDFQNYLLRGRMDMSSEKDITIKKALVTSALSQLRDRDTLERITPEMDALVVEAETLWADLDVASDELIEGIAGDEFTEEDFDYVYGHLTNLIQIMFHAREVNIEDRGNALTAIRTTEKTLTTTIWKSVVWLVLAIIIAAINIGVLYRQVVLKELERTRAEEANKLKDKFLSSMSHELRSPLNTVINFTDFVLTELFGEINEEQKDALQRSSKSARHLLALINDILDMSKIEAGLFTLFYENFNVTEIVEDVVLSGKGLIKNPSEVIIRSEIEGDIPEVVMDKLRTKQILMNLVSNAAKFTTKGEIVVKVTCVDGNLLMSVKDTGVGIPEEDRASIFDEFTQSLHSQRVARKQEAHSTGLGLAITKTCVELHKGKIWLESKVGEGTTFFVQMPIKRAELVALS